MSADVLKDLLARVEAAPGPDRELDARIFIALDRPAHALEDDDLIPQPDGLIGIPGHKRALFEAERYTGSLDVVLGLVERVNLSEAGIIVMEALHSLSTKYRWHCAFSREGQLALLPLAVCTALLSVEIAQAEDAAHTDVETA